MLYDLVKQWKGQEEVVMTGERSKVNDRRKTLLASTKGGAGGRRQYRVGYEIRPSEDVEKFKAGPNTQKFSGGDAQPGPPLVKWDK